MSYKDLIKYLNEFLEGHEDFDIYINGRSLLGIDICCPGKPLIERGDPKNIYITFFTEKTDTSEGYYTFIEK